MNTHTGWPSPALSNYQLIPDPDRVRGYFSLSPGALEGVRFDGFLAERGEGLSPDLPTLRCLNPPQPGRRAAAVFLWYSIFL